MPYAVVKDVPASWEQYARIAEAIGNPGPPGLILHIAGPTDEGFRTIEIWHTREAWQHWHERSSSTGADPLPWSAVTLRELSALNAVPGPDTAPTSSHREPGSDSGERVSTTHTKTASGSRPSRRSHPTARTAGVPKEEKT